MALALSPAGSQAIIKTASPAKYSSSKKFNFSEKLNFWKQPGLLREKI
jgi:hypothetical protein